MINYTDQTYSGFTPVPGQSATAFQDGYTYNAAFVKAYKMSFFNFSVSCTSGLNVSVGYTSPGGNSNSTVTYAPGTPYQTSDGSYICAAPIQS